MHKIESKTGIFLTTLQNVEGYTIEEYNGIVTGTVVYGANFIKDYFARIQDKFGGRVSDYEKVVREAMEAALFELAENAKSRGANAVIGIEMDASAIGDSMFMATALGNAVGMNKINKEID